MRLIPVLLLAVSLNAAAEWRSHVSVQASFESDWRVRCDGNCAVFSRFSTPDNNKFSVSFGTFYTGLPVHLGATLDLLDSGTGATLRVRWPLVDRLSLEVGLGVRGFDVNADPAAPGEAKGDLSYGVHGSAQIGYGPVFVRYSRLDTDHTVAYRALVGTNPDGSPIYGAPVHAVLDSTFEAWQIGLSYNF